MLLALLASGPGAGDGGCPPAPGRPLEAQSAAPLREPCILQERLPWSSEAQHTDMAVPPVCLQECQAQVLQGRPGETLTMEEGAAGLLHTGPSLPNLTLPFSTNPEFSVLAFPLWPGEHCPLLAGLASSVDSCPALFQTALAWRRAG